MVQTRTRGGRPPKAPQHKSTDKNTHHIPPRTNQLDDSENTSDSEAMLSGDFSMTAFERHECGDILLPSLDSDVPVATYRTVIQDFFESIWSELLRDGKKRRAPFPWDHFCANPSAFLIDGIVTQAFEWGETWETTKLATVLSVYSYIVNHQAAGRTRIFKSDDTITDYLEVEGLDEEEESMVTPMSPVVGPSITLDYPIEQEDVDSYSISSPSPTQVRLRSGSPRRGGLNQPRPRQGSDELQVNKRKGDSPGPSRPATRASTRQKATHPKPPSDRVTRATAKRQKSSPVSVASQHEKGVRRSKRKRRPATQGKWAILG
ncbi:hypothetical protein ONZ45_g9423 [Pleurotus djamor]|nr:hypothetical protein ONZ45_g9423 [Pleurotus djamor]